MRPHRRFSIAALVAAAAALTVGCVPMPPATTPVDPGPEPTIPTTAPEPTEPVETPEPEPTDPDPQPTQIPDDGELPAYLPLEEQLPGGYASGWSTTIMSDTDRFEPLDDNDFPAGPTISVHDTETDCLLWAYNSLFDPGTDDLGATAIAVGEVTAHEDGDEFDMSTLDFGPNPAQGITVEFAVAESVDDRGTWAVRVYGSIASAQFVQAVCATPEEELDYLDEVASGLLVPDFL